MALALRGRGDLHRHGAERIETDCGGRLRTVFRPGAPPLLGRQSGRDISHIRDARLDDGRKADAVVLSLSARRITARHQICKSSVAHGSLKSRSEIS